MDESHMPVLLRASRVFRALNYVVPPPQPTEKYHLYALRRQPLALAGNALTTNEIVPVNIVHYEVGSLHSFATQIFVTRSPIFLVHWEVCRPTDVIEKFSNPRLRRVADVLIESYESAKAEILRPSWLPLILFTSFGVHRAVQRVIVSERAQKVYRIRARRIVVQRRHAADFVPVSETHTLIIQTAPQKQVLRLCAVDDEDDETAAATPYENTRRTRTTPPPSPRSPPHTIDDRDEASDEEKTKTITRSVSVSSSHSIDVFYCAKEYL